MKKSFILLIAALLLVVLMTPAASAQDAQVWYKLIAGQTWHVGNIGVSIDANGDLHVVYKAFEGYCLNEIHTHAAYDLAAIPQRNGNPIPGQFDYKADGLDCARRAEAVIPGDWDASIEAPIYVAAHAVVGMVADPEWSETGWGLWCGVKNLERFGFPGNNWATYILYTGELKTLNPYR